MTAEVKRRLTSTSCEASAPTTCSTTGLNGSQTPTGGRLTRATHLSKTGGRTLQAESGTMSEQGGTGNGLPSPVDILFARPDV
jgi:hypothetical protein